MRRIGERTGDYDAWWYKMPIVEWAVLFIIYLFVVWASYKSAHHERCPPPSHSSSEPSRSH